MINIDYDYYCIIEKYYITLSKLSQFIPIDSLITAFACITEKIPRRGILGAMMFLACMFSYVIRTNLSITIVAMVNVTGKDGGVGPACSVADLNTNKTVVLKDVSWRSRNLCRNFNKIIL